MYSVNICKDPYQKFPTTITFFKIITTSLIFNQFIQSLGRLVDRNVYYIVYKLHPNRMRIERVIAVRKNAIKLKYSYSLCHFVDRLLIWIRPMITRTEAIMRCKYLSMKCSAEHCTNITIWWRWQIQHGKSMFYIEWKSIREFL